MQWFLDFEEKLSNIFGYRSVVHFEDSIVFLSGIFIGMLIMAVLCGRVVFRLQKIQNLGSSKVKLLRFRHEGFKHFIADPHNVGESIETLFLVIFRPLFQVKEYSYRDEKRTKIFLIIMFIIGLIIFALAIMCVSTVIVDHIDIK